MKKLSIIAKSILIAMSVVGAANADENLSQYSMLNTWTGFYVGANAGFIFNSVQLKSQQLGFRSQSGKCNTSSDYFSFSPGIQLGYTYQFPTYFVTGIEANVNFNTHQNDSLDCNCPFNAEVTDHFSFRNRLQSSIKGRVGQVVNWNQTSLLPYVTAGASFANVGITYNNEGGDHYSQNTNQAGWLVGAGIELALMEKWSLRAEYNYVNYGNAVNLPIWSVYGLVDPNGKGHAKLSSNNIILAMNYWI